MALRKPLVIINGQVQQISSSDTLDASVSEVDVVSKVNGEAGAVVCGTPCYAFSATSIKKGQANALSTAKVFGLMKDTSVAAAGSGMVQTDGILTLTTTQWDAVAGTSGGLAFGTVYYLSAATAGLITATAPTTVGQYVIPVGMALSTTELDIGINVGTLIGL